MRRYIVGIDLGTTHTVVAYAPLAAPARGKRAAARPDIALFHIEQLVAPGEVAALPLLPSVRYHAGAGDIAAGELQLPWPSTPSKPEAGETSPIGETAESAPVIVGQWARQLGAQTPGRLVTSAKSWLSHAAADRLAPILPWGAPAEVAKVSPVEASASYLRHVRSAWDAKFPGSPLAQQELVLTVPASFDESARALTLSAARQAGLAGLRLLEEPQAVFYDWLFRHRASLAAELAQTRRVLVCDVGGGTTDLSLIDVALAPDGPPALTRIGVGQHLMLGGDNMDLALAHVAEARLAAASPDAPRLSAARLSQLVDRCRAAKELLLAADAPAQAQVTLLGGGARLIGASRSVTLSRAEVRQLVVDGFFPQVEADAQPSQGRSGLVEFGLPYARDPAITRHIASFLRQHGPVLPDALLLNGGVFRAEALAQRLADTLGAWRGEPLRLLHNDNPDVAVARGAVAYALSQRGQAPKIGGGSARSYFLLLDSAAEAGQPRGGQRGICILPRGSETGQEAQLTGRTFALRLGRPVRFHLFSATADAAGQAPAALGELVTLNDEDFVRLPPIVMVLQANAGAGATDSSAPPPAPEAAARPQDIAVQLAVSLTEVGTLAMHCVSLADARQRWQLEFDLRHGSANDDTDAGPPGSPGAEATQAAPRLREAIGHIDRIFGSHKQPVDAKEVRQLRQQLEHRLGSSREQWATPVLRQLFDALWQRARGRRRSAEHERVWLNLAGFCLRPGFGDPLDGWRMTQLWTLFAPGAQHAHDHQVCTEWWTLWRRVAGGLAAPEQLRLLEDFAFNLQINAEGLDDPAAARPVKGSDDDMLRLGASLERIPADYKAEIGAWLLGRLQTAETASVTPAHAAASRQRARPDAARDSLTLWALGRIGVRQPFYGSPHDVAPADAVAGWVTRLLALDWKRVEPAAFAAVSLARVTGDRTRDLPLALREQVMARLAASHAPPAWIAMVREKVELDEATERRVLGESLPPGLRLMA